ncbi:MAG: serine/threonine protein kinase [Planctomycetaceae bacterium]|nr:serine/threonine protein kinase [Planctomycetaceae bacterium]
MCLAPMMAERTSVISGRETLYMFEEIANRRGQYLTEIRYSAIDDHDEWIASLKTEPALDFEWLIEYQLTLPARAPLPNSTEIIDRLCHHSTGRLAGFQMGPYELLYAVAAGGFGTIYAAAETQSHQLVAVKVLEAFPSLQHLDRFEREFEKLAMAKQHPNVIRCFEQGCSLIEGREYPWYSMEFAGGGDLADRIEDRRTSTNSESPWNDPAFLTQVIGEFRAVTEAVHYLHHLEILHRDIKPSNVLILEDGSLKLSDFGLVKSLQPTEKTLLQREATSTGAVLGTRDYMAVEQERGQEVDKRTDIYSLGVLLAELVTGQHPQPDIYVNEGSTLNSWAPLRNLPTSLRRLILRCTDTEADRRPDDTQMLLDQFDRVVSQIKME